MKNLVFIIIFLSSGAVFSDPVVIYEIGDTVPVAQYLKALDENKLPDYRTLWVFNQLPQAHIDDNKNIDQLFPFDTNRMSPGTPAIIVEDDIPASARPFCILGSNKQSLQWARKNATALAEHNAYCLLVAADSMRSARQIVDLLSGVPVYLAKGDTLSDYFNINHYPVLLTGKKTRGNNNE